MLRPKAKPPVTRVSAAREAEEAEPDLSPEGAEVAFARSAEAREHRGKRPPKEGVTTNNDTGWYRSGYSNNNNINYAIATATTAPATYNF